MKKIISLGIVCLFLGVIAISQIQCTSTNENKEMTKEEMVARGKYLVNLGGCNDCHSPKIMTAMGPIPDTTRLLSGHPANEMLAPIDPSMIAPGKWVLTSGTDFTAWVGPWGISYAANLSPDRETGTGAWTPEVFIKALRTGKMMGAGRPCLRCPGRLSASCQTRISKQYLRTYNRFLQLKIRYRMLCRRI